MNDSCDCRVRRAQIPSNQVFPVETATTILHVTLTRFRKTQTENQAPKRRKSSKINKKEENLVRHLMIQALHSVGAEIHRRQAYEGSAERLNDRQLAISTCRGGAVRGAVEALLKVHQREKRRQNPLLIFVRQAQAADRNAGEFIRGGLHPVGNFGLARRRGFAYRDFAAQLRAVMLDRSEEVLDTKDFCFKLLRNGNLAPAQAGRTGHRGGHTPTLFYANEQGPYQSTGERKAHLAPQMGVIRRELPSFIRFQPQMCHLLAAPVVTVCNAFVAGRRPVLATTFAIAKRA